MARWPKAPSRNRIYRGRIVHKDKHYPGEHEAIVDEALWDEVQRQLAANRVNRASGVHAAESSLLAGLIYDDSGQRMTPSHANKKGTRYRYYVSQALVSGNRRSAPRARRVPAGDVERLVEERLTAFLRNQGEIFDAVEPLFDDVNKRQEERAEADAVCEWCDSLYTARAGRGGPAQRFCSDRCRAAFNGALRGWARRELEAGRLDIADLREA